MGSPFPQDLDPDGADRRDRSRIKVHTLTCATRAGWSCTCKGEPLANRLTTKDTNPKDAVGVRKAPMSTVPMGVVFEIGLAMIEGGRKYGRHNYRVAGVLASVYYDAAMRHLASWWEGEDIDPDSGLSHVTKALSSLTVLRDAMMNAKLTDDRPPRLPEGWLAERNAEAGRIIDKHPNAPAPYTAASDESRILCQEIARGFSDDPPEPDPQP